MPGPVVATGDTTVVKESCHHRAYSSGEKKKNKKQVSKIYSIIVHNTCSEAK